MIEFRKYLLDKESYKDSLNVKAILDLVPLNVEIFKDEAIISDCITTKNSFHDVEMFDAFDNSNQTVFNKLTENTVYLKGTLPFIKQLIQNPAFNKNILEKKQDFLSTYKFKYHENIEKIDNLFRKMSDYEDILAWVFESDSREEFKTVKRMLFFNSLLTRPLNCNGNVLTLYNLYKIVISPLLGIITPIIYFLIPYFIMRYRFKVPLQFFPYMKMIILGAINSPNMFLPKIRGIGVIAYVISLFLYFQGLFNSIELSITGHTLSKLIVNKINDYIEYVNIGEEIYDMLWSEEIEEVMFRNTNIIPYESKHLYREFDKQD